MIKLLKLSTGEEIIAEKQEERGSIVIKNPVKMGLTAQGIAMMPFSPFLKANNNNIILHINSSHIIFEGEVDEEIVNAYNSKFGSGIVLAPPGLRLTE